MTAVSFRFIMRSTDLKIGVLHWSETHDPR